MGPAAAGALAHAEACELALQRRLLGQRRAQRRAELVRRRECLSRALERADRLATERPERLAPRAGRAQLRCAQPEARAEPAVDVRRNGGQRVVERGATLDAGRQEVERIRQRRRKL